VELLVGLPSRVRNAAHRGKQRTAHIGRRADGGEEAKHAFVLVNPAAHRAETAFA
jgi:hypothetical protein